MWGADFILAEVERSRIVVAGKVRLVCSREVGSGDWRVMSVGGKTRDGRIKMPVGMIKYINTFFEDW